MTAVLQAALAFEAAGCSVIPAAADGTKAPIGAWKEYQARRPDPALLQTWLQRGHPGIGLVTGAISGTVQDSTAGVVTGAVLASGSSVPSTRFGDMSFHFPPTSRP